MISIIALLFVASFSAETTNAFTVLTSTPFRTHTNLNQMQEIGDGENDSKRNFMLSSRREIFRIISGCVTFGALLSPTSSRAACLSGDPSPDCIGVYKVPIDDAIESYIDTPENCAKFAPDLNWVPIPQSPKSPKLAKEELLTMDARLQKTIALVQKGDLTNAGVEVLSIIPRVTVAGRVVVSHLESDSKTSMRALRYENAHYDVLSSLGSSDIVLGQAIAGRFGSITVAQIQVLEELNDAKASFKELLRAMPDDM
uniref:Uncharacterized protein n=1 Tax=Chaetoceros debilis TaxID=122233 RepID=A0A7S3PV11_9STRA|mmetsp:Transcript_29680/g.45399  ORF Transcript_29680/g.45399 Transcript_29680/m.45399 type:complete len:256 (+) Transcript_29680:69-836(+)